MATAVAERVEIEVTPAPTVAEVDRLIAQVRLKRFVARESLPAWLDVTGERVITQINDKKALIDSGVTTRHLLAETVIDRLLDIRNELSPPIRAISDD